MENIPKNNQTYSYKRVIVTKRMYLVITDYTDYTLHYSKLKYTGNASNGMQISDY